MFLAFPPYTIFRRSLPVGPCSDTTILPKSKSLSSPFVRSTIIIVITITVTYQHPLIIMMVGNRPVLFTLIILIILIIISFISIFAIFNTINTMAVIIIFSILTPHYCRNHNNPLSIILIKLVNNHHYHHCHHQTGSLNISVILNISG